MEALEKNGYVMPEGFILPVDRQASMGSDLDIGLVGYPEFKLDTEVLQLCNLGLWCFSIFKISYAKLSKKEV